VRILRPVLLLLLHRGEAHGYTLLEDLVEFGLGDLAPSVVYRALRDMEAKDWVDSAWDEEETQGPPRRVYRLTATGDDVLGWWIEDMWETRRMIDYMLGAYAEHMQEGAGEHH
jgi:DNA-binding PadR family transcriptional regulator